MRTQQTHLAFINGVSIWAPHLPGWSASVPVLCGREQAPATPARRPSPAILPPTERRRAPDTVVIALEIAARACEAASVAPADLPSVFASTHGDLAISDHMCATLAATPTLISPVKFHNSVHNAAAGYWSIATGCRAPYTAVSAYRYTFGAGLLEAFVQVETSGGNVLYAAYDVEACGPLASMSTSTGIFGAGLVVGSAPAPACVARITWMVRRGDASEASCARPENHALVAGNAMAACLPFFEALAAAEGNVIIPLGSELVVQVGVSAASSQR